MWSTLKDSDAVRDQPREGVGVMAMMAPRREGAGMTDLFVGLATARIGKEAVGDGTARYRRTAS